MPLLPEQTIRYKTYVKQSLVEALRSVFSNHPDTLIRNTKISVDYPTSQARYPTVIVRFHERDIQNAGVGHVEYILRDNSTTIIDKFRHYLYHGDIEFAIFALSSKDRDLISDAVVQVLAMPDTATYTNSWINRLYFPADDTDGYDEAKWNYVNLNSDVISPFGETQTQQPWLSEDQLQYQTSYRVGIYGEFYSLPPVDDVTAANGVIEKVNVYPYIEDLEPVPEGTNDPSPWP